MDSKKGEQPSAKNAVNIEGGDALVTIKDKNWKSLEEAKKDVYNTVLGALTNFQKESKQKVNDLVKSGGLNPKVLAIASTGMGLEGDANPFFAKNSPTGNTENSPASIRTNVNNAGNSEFQNMGERTQSGIDNLQEFSSGKTKEVEQNPVVKTGAGANTTSSGIIDRKQYLVQPDEYDGQGTGSADPDPQEKHTETKETDKKTDAKADKKNAATKQTEKKTAKNPADKRTKAKDAKASKKTTDQKASTTNNSNLTKNPNSTYKWVNEESKPTELPAPVTTYGVTPTYSKKYDKELQDKQKAAQAANSKTTATPPQSGKRQTQSVASAQPYSYDPLNFGSNNPSNYVELPKDSTKANGKKTDQNDSVKMDPATMTPSTKLITYMKSVEPRVPGVPDLVPYNDDFNHATVGYGHMLHRSKVTKADIEKYKGYTIEKADADFEKYLQNEGTGPVQRNTKVKLTQYQFDALVDFSFNTGQSNFAKSKLLEAVNKNITDGETVKEYFHQFNYVPWRKDDEYNIFVSGVYNVKVAGKNTSTKTKKKTAKKISKKTKKRK